MTPPRSLQIRSTGPMSTVQDRGRPGWFSSGVGVSGAADRRSHALANRLVGNEDAAATIECLLGGLEFEAHGSVEVAVTGAPVAVTVDGRPMGHSTVIAMTTGQRLCLGTARAGLRAYVAVRGGIDAEPVLGSRSRDTLSGLGPPVLAAGAVLTLGNLAGPSPTIAVAPIAEITDAPVVAHVILGPRDDWFVEPADLFIGWWDVTDRTDRVGARLHRHSDFPALVRLNDKELRTEGMPLGAIQVPPSGEPVVFLADHPITGGYPVIGTVVDADIDAIAQVRPGHPIVFRPASIQPTPRDRKDARPT